MLNCAITHGSNITLTGTGARKADLLQSAASFLSVLLSTPMRPTGALRLCNDIRLDVNLDILPKAVFFKLSMSFSPDNFWMAMRHASSLASTLRVVLSTCARSRLFATPRRRMAPSRNSATVIAPSPDWTRNCSAFRSLDLPYEGKQPSSIM